MYIINIVNRILLSCICLRRTVNFSTDVNCYSKFCISFLYIFYFFFFFFIIYDIVPLIFENIDFLHLQLSIYTYNASNAPSLLRNFKLLCAQYFLPLFLLSFPLSRCNATMLENFDSL